MNEYRTDQARGPARAGTCSGAGRRNRPVHELSAAGVQFTQEPTERFYGTDCALRDPFGNPIRFTQPPEGPIVVPSAEELGATT